MQYIMNSLITICKQYVYHCVFYINYDDQRTSMVMMLYDLYTITITDELHN